MFFQEQEVKLKPVVAFDAGKLILKPSLQVLVFSYCFCATSSVPRIKQSLLLELEAIVYSAAYLYLLVLD